MPLRGEIWAVDFSPTVGHEQSGIRPALVVSNDRFNTARSHLHMVVPLTTTDRGVPAHLPLLPPEGGVRRPSYVLCDQVRTVSRLRFGRRHGRVEDDTVERVVAMIERFLAQ